MKLHTVHRSTVALCALAAALVLALPAAAQEQAGLVTELIKVTNVSLESAHSLARGACEAAVRNASEGPLPCTDVRYLEDERMLAVTATPHVIAGIRELLADFDRLPLTHSFQIIVLAADRSGTGSADVPANVEQALQDVRDFLPYTGFSVIGSGWLRTANYGTTSLPGAEEFIAELRFRPNTDPAAPVLIEDFSVYRRVAVTTPVEGGHSTQFVRRNVLQTTFTIDPGETVVVGTSKLNGDESAVVVLLTAVQN